MNEVRPVRDVMYGSSRSTSRPSNGSSKALSPDAERHFHDGHTTLDIETVAQVEIDLMRPGRWISGIPHEQLEWLLARGPREIIEVDGRRCRVGMARRA